MTAEQAANLLFAQLRSVPWFTSIGIGEHEDTTSLFLYVKSLRKADLSPVSQGWMGFPVVVQVMGQPRAAHVFTPPPEPRPAQFKTG
jgi:hypothetical protein